jgi:hypothetical protein
MPWDPGATWELMMIRLGPEGHHRQGEARGAGQQGVGATEPAEEEKYRWGFADGFIVAVNYMVNRPSRLSMEELLDRMTQIWEGDLAEWKNGDCSQEILPPELRY